MVLNTMSALIDHLFNFILLRTTTNTARKVRRLLLILQTYFHPMSICRDTFFRNSLEFYEKGESLPLFLSNPIVVFNHIKS